MQLLLEHQIFYTYIYLNPLKHGNFNYEEFHFDYEPFYVGAGHNKRLYSHLKDAESFLEFENNNETDWENYCNAHKINTIKKILRNNTEPIILKVKENLSKKNAFDFEKYLIKLIGRADKKLGPLTNWTDGGEGIVNPSQITIAKRKISYIKTVNNPKWKSTKGKERNKK
jgi:hypothetical protein